LFEAREGVNIFDFEFAKDDKKAMLATSRSRVLNSSYDRQSMLERKIALLHEMSALEALFIFTFNPYRVRGPIQTQSNNH